MAAAISACAREARSEEKKENLMNVVLLEVLGNPTIIILVIAAIFLLFGGSKLPQLAKALGQSKKAFKEGMDEADRDDKIKPDSRAKLESVDDEALFEEARRRAQQRQAEESRKLDR
jgi:sec-independent protein translocase protein TatA